MHIRGFCVFVWKNQNFDPPEAHCLLKSTNLCKIISLYVMEYAILFIHIIIKFENGRLGSLLQLCKFVPLSNDSANSMNSLTNIEYRLIRQFNIFSQLHANLIFISLITGNIYIHIMTNKHKAIIIQYVFRKAIDEKHCRRLLCQ